MVRRRPCAGRALGGSRRRGGRRRPALEGQRRIDAFLLLTSIAEPHTNHLFLHGEPIGQRSNFFGRGLRVEKKGSLERHPHRGLDAGSLFTAPANRVRLEDG